MFKNFINKLLSIDSSIFNVVKIGGFISLSICLISILFLHFFNTYPSSLELFEGGLILFKTGLIFLVQFIISGITIDTIRKTFC